ncbi:hypothetical protein NEHOM01_0801 [Nematocida homosporus]|uniref:uncharacterized protein n=1 Tax=Nematocida homosporus TaxID=1912981 RepID=UPI00221E98A4|nr:uncharacterized protein NEHOM01_0801 [Nematocida homosporus]KAI5185386.1 hypothetical protein NEHOM01_0801 [Nematocida homosporus]
MNLRDTETGSIEDLPFIKHSHGNRPYINKESFETNKESMEAKKNVIYWHKQEIKVGIEPWEESEDTSTASKSQFILRTGINTPGPKAEPPFEIDILNHIFLFKDGREQSVYVIKIASVCASWVIIKKLDEIVGLISVLRKETPLLAKLNMKNLVSIAPEKQEERLSILKLVLNMALSNHDLQAHLQNFVLTNVYPLEEIEKANIEEILLAFTKEVSGVYLVEYSGWLLGWRCGLFQLHNHVLTRTSTKTGKITETINTKECIISLSGRTLRIQQGPQKERSFIANDQRTLVILKKWFS